MSDEALIAGAAAPVGQRWIRSTAVLDAVWVSVTALVLIVSSFSPLIDLPNAYLRTGSEPLRFFVLGLPIIAIVIAVVGAARRSIAVVAAATGVLAPSVALAGSLGASLLLSKASAFAEVGVAVSLGAALLGVVMLIRWFVYHPMPLLGEHPRPSRLLGRVLGGLGAGLALVILITTVLGDAGWSSPTMGQTSFLFAVPLCAVAAGAARTPPASVLAGSACVAQLVAVLIVRAEQSDLSLDSDLLLRTGVAGLIGLASTAVVAIVAVTRSAIEADPVVDTDVAESWRWNVDE